MSKNFFFTLVAILAGCSSVMMQQNEAPHGWIVMQTKNPKYHYGSGKINIKYKSYEELYNDAKKKVGNEMLSPKEAKEALSMIPQGGIIIIYIYRNTIGLANTDSFKYVIKQNDQILMSKKGESDIPETPSGGIFWWNIESIPLYEDYFKNGTLELYVIDTVIGGRDHFIIKKNKLSSQGQE